MTTLIVILGPTAVGKSAVAVRVAGTLGGEIVSADSRQIYRGMEIGAGAPSAEELQHVPHHLVSFIEPDQRLSAGRFAHLARRAVEEVIVRGKLPLVVGGSGLYLRALIDGLAPIPPPDLGLRRRIQEEIRARGMKEMLKELQQVDPTYAVSVTATDRKRLARALEVYRQTGRVFSDWHKPTVPWCVPMMFGLTRPRDELKQIIVRRVRRMMEQGWAEELKRLQLRYHNKLPPAVTEALGYRELLSYLKGEWELERAIDRTIIATRQFAKRQMAWFRRDKRIQWLEQSGENAVDSWVEQIVHFIRERQPIL